MSRILFDYLLDSPLLAEAHDEYARLSEKELAGELAKYRDYVISHLDEVRREAQRPADELSAYFGVTANTSEGASPPDTIRRAALYFDSMVVDDPLFKHTAPSVPYEQDFAKFFGYAAGRTLDRRGVATAAQHVLAVQPFVGADLLKLAPIGLAHEPPTVLGVSYSDTLFAERVPDTLREWFHERSSIKPLIKVEQGWAFSTTEVQLEPTRGIVVLFHGHAQATVFHLSAIKAEQTSDPSIMTFRQWIPNDPPGEREFNAWVTQSINQSAGHLYQVAASDFVNATATNTMLMTDSELISDLLTVDPASAEAAARDVAQYAMQFDLPFFTDLSAEDIVRVRQDSGQSFENYRYALEQGLRDLRHITDGAEVARRFADLRHEFTAGQIPAVERAVQSARKGLMTGAAVGIASLVTAVPSGGTSLAAMLLAGAVAIRGGLDYSHKVREHPAYFLWQLNKQGA